MWNFSGIKNFIFHFIVCFGTLIIQIGCQEQLLVITPDQSAIVAETGVVLNVTCSFHGSRVFAMSWTPPESETFMKKKIEVACNGTECILSFVNPSTSDTGKYNCIALTDVGTKLRRSINIKFTDRPALDSQHQNVSVSEGYDAYLHCRFDRGSPINFTWFDPHDNEIAESFQRFEIGRFDGFSSLNIVGITRNDSGIYTCEGIYNESKERKTFKVTVTYITEPPTFLISYVKVPIVERSSTYLTCSARAGPLAKYTWFDQNTDVITKTTHPQYYIDHFPRWSSLLISNIMNNNSGPHTCKAHNELGTASKIFDLVITDVERPPVFDSIYEITNVTEGSTVVLFCTAKGNPLPQYTWFDENRDEITNGTSSQFTVIDSFSSNFSQLYIFNIAKNNTGKYVCEANNSIGTASKTFSVFVLDLPNKEVLSVIYDVKILNVTDTSVTFNIEVGYFDSAELEGIRVIGQERVENKSIEYYLNEGRNFTFTNLIPSGNYTFRFLAIISNRKTNWSQTTNVIILPKAPELIINNLSDNSLRLEWFRSFNDSLRSTIDHHRIRYKTIRMVRGNAFDYSDPCEVSIIVPSCAGSRYQISRLYDKSYYVFYIEAHTVTGYGKPAELKLYINIPYK